MIYGHQHSVVIQASFSMFWEIMSNSDALLKQKILNGESQFYVLVSACLEMLIEC